MRILFITHDAGIYGAGRSLRMLIRNYPEVNLDLMVAKQLRRHNDLPGIRADFGSNVQRLDEFRLPFERCYKGCPKSIASYLTYTFLWSCVRSRFYRLLHERQYDAIHLNSIVLHPVITTGLPFILHVREIAAGNLTSLYANAQRAKGVIFIDQATRKPFEACALQASTILNNPVDMTPLNALRGTVRIPGLDADPSEKIIFSVIGRIYEEKGVRFIIENFTKVPDERLLLLIVGSGPARALAASRRAAGQDKRIVFWGEEPNIERVLAISDYIVRGEAYQCVGRTIYEGLYAGCDVVVPGNESDLANFFEVERFSRQIHFYPPRNGGAFQAVLRRLRARKIGARCGLSNIPAYVKEFDSFVRNATGRGLT